MSKVDKRDNLFDELEERDGSSGRSERSIKINNTIATIYKGISILGLIIAGGVLLFGCVAYPINNRGGQAEVVSACWSAFFILLCASLAGFATAEVIQILHDIRAKLYDKEKK